jgi:hypothetical protein
MENIGGLHTERFAFAWGTAVMTASTLCLSTGHFFSVCHCEGIKSKWYTYIEETIGYSYMYHLVRDEETTGPDHFQKEKPLPLLKLNNHKESRFLGCGMS